VLLELKCVDCMHVSCCSAGTMCGQWVWNNHNAGNLVCQQLGFQSGEMYTFGRSNYLPNLPVVYGYRTCDGSENNLFNCVAASVGGDEDWRTPADMDCRNGCLGADKINLASASTRLIKVLYATLPEILSLRCMKN
jgi:hypothetical protein